MSKPSNTKKDGTLLRVIDRLIEPGGLLEALGEIDAERTEELERLLNSARQDVVELRADVVFVGSFSSGKSTLINKLLGEEIVPSGRGVVTSRPVWIGPGVDRRVGWLAGGRSSTQRPPAKGTIADWVRESQDAPPSKKEDAWLAVELPKWPFDEGLKLLDTPGFNSEFPEHGARTLKALAEAEVAIVVIEPRGMSSDVREFVQSHVAGKVPVVALVINQLDLVDSGEVPELLERAAAHAKALGLEGSTVIACSARGASDDAGQYSGWEGVRSMLADLAGERVEQVVVEKVSTGLTDAVSGVKTQMAAELDRLEKARALLAKEQDENDASGLVKYSEDRFEKARERIGKRMEACWNSVDGAADEMIARYRKWLEDSDNDPTDGPSVERMLKREFKNFLGEAKSAFEAAGEEAREEVLRFDGEIEKAARKRWTKIAELCPNVALAEGTGEIRFEIGDQTTSVSLGEMPSDVGGTLGGAALGAAIGTVFPIIGTFVGGIVGGFLGAMFGNAREEAAAKIDEVAITKINEILNDLGDKLRAFDNRTDEALVGVYNRRWAAYSEALGTIEANLEEQEAAIEVRMERVGRALDESEKALAAMGKRQATGKEPKRNKAVPA